VTRELPRSSLAAAAEATVAALAIAGDDAAYGELVRRRQVQVRGLLRRLCRDGPLADDLAQQTFLQAWRKLPTVHAPRAFGGWLRKVAISVWLQHVRARHRELWEQAGQAGDPSADSVRAAAHVPALGERLDLDRALAQLAPPVRLCVVLAYAENMSHREIAASTDIPLGTVKSHIARGAARLRQLLRAYE
jgi:RNA polymerase sigma-70 factor, ECF subfamily